MGTESWGQQEEAADAEGMHKPAYERESGTVDTDQYLVLHSLAIATNRLGNTETDVAAQGCYASPGESGQTGEAIPPMCVYRKPKKPHQAHRNREWMGGRQRQEWRIGEIVKEVKGTNFQL